MTKMQEGLSVLKIRSSKNSRMPPKFQFKNFFVQFSLDGYPSRKGDLRTTWTNRSVKFRNIGWRGLDRVVHGSLIRGK